MDTPRRLIVWPIFVLWFGVLTFAGLATTVLFVAVGAWLRAAGRLPELSEVGLAAVLQQIFVTPGVLHASVALSSIPLLLAAFLGARLERVPARERLMIPPGGGFRNVLLGLVAAVAVIGLGQVMECVAIPNGWYEGSTLELIGRAAASLSTPWFIALVVIGSVGPGFGEELFFRGFAQTRLSARWGRWAGILIASALFGITHGDKIHTPMAFLIGLLLGWIADRAQTLWPSIIAHAINNATSFGMTGVLPSDWMEGIYVEVGVASAVLFAIAIVALALLTRPAVPRSMEALPPTYSR